MRIKKLAGGAALACLLALLTACAGNPVIQTRTITVHDPVIVAVPAPLTKPVNAPALPDNPTNADLAHAYLMALQAIADANAKLQQIAGLK